MLNSTEKEAVRKESIKEFEKYFNDLIKNNAKIDTLAWFLNLGMMFHYAFMCGYNFRKSSPIENLN